MRSLYILLCFQFCFSQIQEDVIPPANIKTISFVQSAQNVIPIFKLGERFEIQFDDLYGDEADYYYTITHCNYDWTPSNLAKNEYLKGTDDQRIQEYQNSFNTLQIYSHYSLTIPNQFSTLKLSGNYILKITDEDKKTVFSRRFVIYEPICSVPVQIKRSRDISTRDKKHNLDFSIYSTEIDFKNPLQTVKTVLMQNGNWNNAIFNVKPQYTILNELVYKYNRETQFWAGNEFLFWDTKDVKGGNNTVSNIDLQNIYHSYLYTNKARANSPYTYYPDINGNFFVRNINSELPQTEADYTWVFLSLEAPAFFNKKDIYITGMFNNYALVDDYKMKYNEKSNIYEGTVLAKQGFTSFQYTVADKNGKIDEENALDGNFSQTENTYYVIVYYRENGARYDRIIGLGTGNSQNMIN